MGRLPVEALCRDLHSVSWLKLRYPVTLKNMIFICLFSDYLCGPTVAMPTYAPQPKGGIEIVLAVAVAALGPRQ